MHKQLLFICIFNLHRSVAAEYIFRNVLAQKGSGDARKIEVISAGFIGKELNQWFEEKSIPLPDPLFNQPPPEGVRITLLERGIDISRHRSKPVNQAMLDGSDIIIPLLAILKKDLLTEYPGISGKVFLPKEMLRGESNFLWEDTSVVPYGRDFYDFVHNDSSFVHRIVNGIEEFIQHAFPNILTLLLGPGKENQKTIK